MKPLKNNTALTTVCCLVLMLNACSGGSGEGLDKSDQATSTGDQGADTGANSDTGGDLFTRIQNDILTPDCATSGCHTGTTSPLGLNLSAGQAYASLVSKDSVQVNGLMLVEPSNADASYLVHKLEGTQGGGAQMPMGKPALKAADFALVREWIQAGAPDAQVTTTDTGTVGSTSGDTDNSGSGYRRTRHTGRDSAAGVRRTLLRLSWWRFTVERPGSQCRQQLHATGWALCRDGHRRPATGRAR